MNIIELEEGLRNLIATQPSILNGENAETISGIKNLIEAHKTFSFRIEEYPNQDILKIGILNESSKLELNLTSYVCQVLQERGINIMLYVPKYAVVYNQEINKYVDNIETIDMKEEVESSEQINTDNNQEENAIEKEAKPEEKFYVVEKKIETKPEKVQNVDNNESETQPIITSKTEGRDYLMNLLKK